MTGVAVGDAIDVYKTLCCFPSMKSGQIINKSGTDHIQVCATWFQRDLDKNEKISFIKNYFILGNSVHLSQPQEIPKVEWRVECPSGCHVAVVRSFTQKQGEAKQYIEIWNDNQRLHNINIDALEQHGKIYDDDNLFGCMEWSPLENQLLYIAEKKKPKAVSYFQQKSSSDDDKCSVRKGEEFVYQDDWGEQLTGKVQPVVCVLDIATETVKVLDNLPPDVSAGSAVWCPDGNSVICVGTYNGPFRLGKIYCPIRRSALFYVDLKTLQCEMLGSNDKSVRTPVFCSDGSSFVFLENEAGGPHAQCSRLKVCSWPDKQIAVVTDIIRNISTAQQFPGIFSLTLNKRCWSKDNKRIVTDSHWRSKRELVIIHCDTGKVTRLTDDTRIGSWSLLDIYHDIVLASCSSPNQPPCLMLARLPPYGEEDSIHWEKLDEPASLSDISWEIHSLEAPHDDAVKTFSSINFEYILIKPTQINPDQPLPMIVFPHGGPHSVITPEYMLYMACFCRLGYMIVCVNYRGSYGFGQDSIESLPGHVGTSDVQDVHMAAEKVVASHEVDPKRVFVFGGSHGGFLAGHLIGQYPDFYKAAVMRNPVVNIATMIPSTDIPDWNYVESGLQYSEKQESLGSPDFYAKAWNMSPIKYANKVKAAVLLCIGQNDRRVPNHQAHEYRKALAAHGAVVQMLSYPDNSHPIDKVEAEADCFINIIKWFMEHSS